MTEIEADPDGAQEEAKVFLSYSRKDRERASGIADALRARHFGVFKDTDDILPTEEWKTRLEDLIEEADTIVFLLSPHSAASEVCAWEVEYATSLNKRIAPIVIDDVEGDAIPPLLARLNFIFCTERDPFENAVDTLASALSTDIDWIREHTRLAGLARRWEEAGRAARLLLRGQDIADAEAWRDGRPKEAPEVTPPQAGFIGESRRAAGRRQRNWIAGSAAIAAGAVTLAVFAYLQSVEAERQRDEAEIQRAVAIDERARAEDNERLAKEQTALVQENQRQMLVSQSRFLADASVRAKEAGDVTLASLLALDALPDPSLGPDGQALNTRPLVDAPLVALRAALLKPYADRALLGHGEGLIDVALSRDGSRAASVSTDGTFRLWDIATSTAIAVHEVQPGETTSMLFAADPRFLFVGSDEGRVALASLEAGTLVFRNKAHRSAVTAMALAPDGGTYVTGSARGGVKTWAADSGDPLNELEGHQDKVNQIAFLGSGERFATASDDGTARIWDLTSGEIVQLIAANPISGEANPVLTVAYDRHRNVIATGDAKGVITIWDAGSREKLAAANAGGGAVSDLRFASSGAHLVASLEMGGVRVLRTGELTEFVTVLNEENPLYPVSIDAGGGQVVTASGNGRIQLWDLQGLSDTRELLFDDPERGVSAWSFSDDSRHLAVGLSDGGVRLWNLESGAPVELVGRHDTEVYDVAFSPDGALIASAAALDRIVRIWSVETGAEIATLNGYGAPILFSPDGASLALEGEDGVVALVDTVTWTERGRLAGHESSIIHAGFSPDGDRLVTTSLDGTARIWKPEERAEVAVIAERDAQPSIARFDARGRRLLLGGGANGFVALFDSETGALLTRFEGHSGAILSAAFHPSGDFVLTAGDDGAVRLWDAATGREVTRYVEEKNAWFVAEMSPDGGMVATSRALGVDTILQSRILLWDSMSGAPMAWFEAPGNLVWVGFSNDGDKVFVNSDKGQVWIWRLNEGLARIGASPEAIVDFAKSEMARCLTPQERAQFYLPPEPPRWCVTGTGNEGETDRGNWSPAAPYRTDAWAEWLIAKDAGEDATLPSGDSPDVE